MWLAGQIVPEMTCKVSCGILNPATSYYMLQVHTVWYSPNPLTWLSVSVLVNDWWKLVSTKSLWFVSSQRAVTSVGKLCHSVPINRSNNIHFGMNTEHQSISYDHAMASQPMTSLTFHPSQNKANLLYTEWPLVWKTWKCQGIWQLSGECQGFY